MIHILLLMVYNLIQTNVINKDSFLIFRTLCVCIYMCVLVAQSCPALCNSMDCNLPGSSVHGIFQARILEQVVISYSRGSSQPRDGNPHLLCLLHWQADSLPLSHLGSPFALFKNKKGQKRVTRPTITTYKVN